MNHYFLSIRPRVLNLNLQYLLMWAFGTLYGGSFIDHFKFDTWALTQGGCLPGLLWYFLPRVVYEGQALECVLDGCTTEEDIVHTFRVAAMNEVGRGPYSMPVTFTQRKACEFKLKCSMDRKCLLV